MKAPKFEAARSGTVIPIVSGKDDEAPDLSTTT